MSALIEVRGVINRFGTHVVHDGLNLSIQKGEILGIVGGSGSGKSVLMNTILGLRQPQGGEVKLFGLPRQDMSQDEQLGIDSRLGVLFQGGALFSSLTVRQNIMVPMREHTDLSDSLMYQLADLKVSMVGLPPEAATKKPADLSGGMKKRAGLARALALDPEVLFLDEPTAGLDPIGAAAFDDLIVKLATAMGLTVVMITHDLDSLYTICDRIAVLADKKIVASEPLDTLLHSDHPWVQEYFGGVRSRAALSAQKNREAG